MAEQPIFPLDDDLVEIEDADPKEDVTDISFLEDGDVEITFGEKEEEKVMVPTEAIDHTANLANFLS